MIVPMASTQTPQPRLLIALLLACLLVAGRSAIASHVYEHDLAQSADDCPVCEMGQFSKDDLAVAPGPGGPAAVRDGVDRASGAGVVLRRLVRYLARAPPAPVG